MVSELVLPNKKSSKSMLIPRDISPESLARFFIEQTQKIIGDLNTLM